MFGKEKSAKGNAEKNKKGEDLEKIESDSIMNSDWQMPEMIANQKREAVGRLIANSPDQAASVLKKWLNADIDEQEK